LIKPPLCLSAVPTEKTHFQLPESQLTDLALSSFEQTGVATRRPDRSLSTLRLLAVQFPLHSAANACFLAGIQSPEHRRDSL
jgi:hypothetical protein